MHIIKVIGTTPPCAKCKRAEQEVRKLESKFPGQIRVLKVDAMHPEAEQYGVVVTPMVVIDDEVVARGKILTADQLERHIRKAFGG